MNHEHFISWDEWKQSRAAKRANLERLGLDKPSRRQTDFGKSGLRLRKAFNMKRVPDFTIGVSSEK